MRSFLLATTLIALPVAGFAQTQCAVKAPPVITEAPITLPPPVSVGGPQVPLTPTPVVAPSQPATPPPPSNSTSTTTTSAKTNQVPDFDVKAVPALAHIAAAGAALSDLGMSHGLRTVTAKHGGQVMVFEVAPDGQAAVAGLMTDMSVDQLHALGGTDIKDLGPQHGLQAFFLHNGQQFQVFYAAPDGQRIIPGVMWDASGKDLTRDLVASIPGAIPTVTIGGDAAPTATAASIGTGEAAPASLLAIAQATVHGTIGNSDAPELWMFIDPQCAFSIRAMQQLTPYVASGKVHLEVIPLSILDREDDGLSTRAALNLVSLPSDQMVTAWENGRTTGTPAADASTRLQSNMAAAAAIHLQGTPTFIWRKPDGTEGRLDGIPQDIGGLVASIGR